MKNPNLFKIASGQKAKLDPNMQEAFERIVLAGMAFLYKDDSTSSMSLKEIEQAQDKPQAIGEGIATVMLFLSGKSKNSMPWEAGVLAGYALVCEALDYAEQKGMVTVDNTTIDAAMEAYGQKLMNLMKIDNNQVRELTAKAQQQQGATQ